MKAAALKEFRTIPGAGKSIAGDFWNLGWRKAAGLKRQDPQRLYDALGKFQGARVDRCMLHVMRCAVCFASTQKPEPELLKWWHCKDRT